MLVSGSSVCIMVVVGCVRRGGKWWVIERCSVIDAGVAGIKCGRTPHIHLVIDNVGHAKLTSHKPLYLLVSHSQATSHYIS